MASAGAAGGACADSARREGRTDDLRGQAGEGKGEYRVHVPTIGTDPTRAPTQPWAFLDALAEPGRFRAVTSQQLAQLDADRLPRRRRALDRGHHDLRLQAGAERRADGRAVEDRLEEAPGLVVAEDLQRIAGARVARRAGLDQEALGHRDALEAAALAAHLHAVRIAEAIAGAGAGAVDFAEVVAGGAVAAAAGDLRALEAGGGALPERADAGDPVVDVGRVRRAGGVDARVVDAVHQRADLRERADQVVPVVEAMREHVAELAGAGFRLQLAPRQIATAPILEALCTEMHRIAQRAARHQVPQVPHRRHEAIRERRHVDDAGRLGRVAASRGPRRPSSRSASRTARACRCRSRRARWRDGRGSASRSPPRRRRRRARFRTDRSWCGSTPVACAARSSATGLTSQSATMRASGHSATPGT